jgi:tripartite-type tricarboxylate transporter receptor subunit TctC
MSVIRSSCTGLLKALASKPNTIRLVANRSIILAIVVATLNGVSSIPLRAENYPTRTVRILTNSSAGGTYDIFARALASELNKRWNTAVIVEPRPGGNFMIAGRACADAARDGYTLCVLSGETLVYADFLYKNVTYNSRKDFAPVTNLFFNTQALVANTSLGVKTLKGLIALGKTKPLAFSAPAVGQLLFLKRLIGDNGLNMVSVPFRGGGEAIAALLNGSTPILFSGGLNFPPLISDGKIVGLAVDSPKRSPLFPNVPTFSEQGYTEKLNRNYVGLVVPAGTPTQIINRLHTDVADILNAPTFRQKQLIDRALEPIAGTSEEFARFLDQDRTSFAEVVRDGKVERQ